MDEYTHVDGRISLQALAAHRNVKYLTAVCSKHALEVLKHNYEERVQSLGMRHAASGTGLLLLLAGLAEILQEGVGLFVCSGMLQMRGGGRLRRSS